MSSIIEEKVNTVLAEVFEHYYPGMPEFAEYEEPDCYAVYNIHEKPDNFASGKYHAKTYWVSLSIISDALDRSLYEQTENAFVTAGFIYSSGTDVPGYESSESYPHRYRYSQEYLISVDI